MRITQILANKAANLLTAKTAQAIEIIEKEVDSMANDAYMKSLPKGLLAFDKANPGWITKEDDLRVKYHSNGIIQTYYVGGGTEVPVKDGGARLVANKTLRAKIIRLEELREKQRSLKKEVYAAVLALGTSTQVIKAFPETAFLFGATNASEPANVSPNIIELKTKLKKQ